jgi:hypothetical protein
MRKPVPQDTFTDLPSKLIEEHSLITSCTVQGNAIKKGRLVFLVTGNLITFLMRQPFLPGVQCALA